MKLNMAVLCDRATVREGLLHILGAGVTRCSLVLPGSPDLDLALLVQAEDLNDFAGKHSLSVIVADHDGTEVGRADFGWEGPAIDVQPTDDSSLPQLPLVVPIRGMILENPGEHTITVLIDDEEAARTAVMVAKAEMPSVTVRLA
ncbi:DUF6941 family protein [Streptomyces sp. SGAir0924]|uniref:DUF6941 family protein n=1 Tax=Streptomyces sp. SGAir0924 TaxID=2109593 RepID=UPI0010CD3C08|nr:hypothetical protein [Streptomyces sp. SGAir0924]QCR49822.1 hypothetical protein C1N79_26195 [Streptomyces sp. SGAir0924]